MIHEELARQMMAGKVRPIFGDVDHLKALQILENKRLQSIMDRFLEETECPTCNGRGHLENWYCPHCFKTKDNKEELFFVKNGQVFCKKCKEEINEDD